MCTLHWFIASIRSERVYQDDTLTAGILSVATRAGVWQVII
jgi:hypothetical protein